MGVKHDYPNEPLKDWVFAHPANEYEEAGSYKPEVFPDELVEFIQEDRSHRIAVGRPDGEHCYVVSAPSMEEKVTIKKWIRDGNIIFLLGVKGEGREYPVQMIYETDSRRLYSIE